MAASPRAQKALLLLLTGATLSGGAPASSPAPQWRDFYDYFDDNSTSPSATNMPPEFVNPVDTLNATAGQVFRFRLPADTCHDAEDGDATHLQLRLLDKNLFAPSQSPNLFQLDANTTEIYGFPLPWELGGYEFVLECRDADDNRVRRPLQVRVLPSPTPLPPPAVFSLSVTTHFSSFQNDSRMRMEVIEMIAKAFGDSTQEMMSVLDIGKQAKYDRHNPWDDGTVVKWSNRSFRAAAPCPVASILRLHDVLVSAEGVSPSLRRHLSPAFNVTRASVTLSPECKAGVSALDKSLQERVAAMTSDYIVPVIRQPLEDITATAGAVLRWSLGRDVCSDVDGGYRNPRISMRTWHREVFRGSWLRFRNGQFYGLPLPEDVGEKEFILECEYSRGKKVAAIQRVVVQPATQLPLSAPAQFSFTVDYSYGILRSTTGILLNVLEQIANFFGDRTPELISVARIEPTGDRDAVITWHNTSLGAAPMCPVAAIRSLHDVVASPGGVRPSLHRHFNHFKVTDASVTLSQRCLVGAPWAILAGIPISPVNTPPRFLSHIETVEAPIGKVIKFQLPTDICYDAEDGDASHLHFRLLDEWSKKEVDKEFWLQLDSSRMEIYGIALEGISIKFKLFLECQDSAGSRVTTAFSVVPQPGYSVPRPTPAIFTLSVTEPVATLRKDAAMLVDLIEKIASAYGDSTPKLISVSSIEPAADGGTFLTWFNSSLRASPPCPVASILRLHDVLASAEGVSPSLRRHFSPAFNVTRASVVLTPHCLAGKPWAAGDALVDLRDPFRTNPSV